MRGRLQRDPSQARLETPATSAAEDLRPERLRGGGDSGVGSRVLRALHSKPQTLVLVIKQKVFTKRKSASSESEGA